MYGSLKVNKVPGFLSFFLPMQIYNQVKQKQSNFTLNYAHYINRFNIGDKIPVFYQYFF